MAKQAAAKNTKKTTTTKKPVKKTAAKKTTTVTKKAAVKKPKVTIDPTFNPNGVTFLISTAAVMILVALALFVTM